MYNRRFFDSKLGQAAIASIAAMVVFVAISSQMHASQTQAATIAYENALVDIA
ncbi:MAG: hypothetical protein AAF941_04160 [Pseudomonadota bacterium]